MQMIFDKIKGGVTIYDSITKETRFIPETHIYYDQLWKSLFREKLRKLRTQQLFKDFKEVFGE